MYFKEELIKEIKSKNDIVDVILDYVELQKRGDSYLGKCPFHDEQSVSFSVSLQKQTYYCFECGAAGNVITFIMEHNSCSFADAVRILEERIDKVKKQKLQHGGR